MQSAPAAAHYARPKVNAENAMDCRPGCGACCIAPSISSPLPGLPGGKKAGEPCPALLADYRCALFADPRRPSAREHALSYLINLEQATAP